MLWYPTKVEKRFPIPKSKIVSATIPQSKVVLSRTIVAHGLKVDALQIREQESIFIKDPGAVPNSQCVGGVAGRPGGRQLLWCRRHDGGDEVEADFSDAVEAFRLGLNSTPREPDLSAKRRGVGFACRNVRSFAMVGMLSLVVDVSWRYVDGGKRWSVRSGVQAWWVCEITGMLNLIPVWIDQEIVAKISK